MGFFNRSTTPAKPPTSSKIPPHEMANKAMSDNMTIGLEQIVVTFTLMIVSLCVLSRHHKELSTNQIQWRKMIIGGGKSLIYVFVSMVLNILHQIRNFLIVTMNKYYDWKEKQIINGDSYYSDNMTTPESSEHPTTNNTNNNINNNIKNNPRFDTIPSPMRKIQSSPMVSSIPLSIVTTKGGFLNQNNNNISTPSSVNGIPPQSPYQVDDFQHPMSTSNHNNFAINDEYNKGGIDDDNYDELTTLTDHERFTRAYETHLRYSEYRRLILPPTCRLLDAKTTAGLKKNSNDKNGNTDGQNQIGASASIDEENENDQSLFRIISWVIDITHKIVSFDYIGYMLLFNIRIVKALICRYKRVLLAWGYNVRIDDEEDDEDDVTVNSCGSKKSLLSKDSLHGHIGIGISPRRASSSKDVSTQVVPNRAIMNVQPSDSMEKQTRERFYTSDAFIGIPKSKGKEELTQSKIDLNRSLEFSRTDSVASLTGYVESWEYDPKQQNVTTPMGPQNQNFDSSFSIPPENVLLEEDDEKSEGQEFDENGVHINLDQSGTVIASDMMSPPNLTEVEIVLSPSSIDDPMSTDNTVSKTSQNKGPYLSPINQSRFTLMPRQLSKKKDKLEVWRNPAASSGSLSSLKFAQEKTKPSTELSYFDTAANKSTIQKLERETALPDRQGYILGDQLLVDSKDTPLLIFVNSRSGSQQGLMLKMQLKSLMNPIQVWDLADGGPEKILRSFMVFTRLRILVCGGDGTVSWIISALDKMTVERWPPIAILPLGTGNDLARIHGWGGGYANESFLLILNQVQESYISLLDRWNVKIKRKKKKNSDSKEGVKKPFTNYMSIGMDALSALQVHNLRENSPDMFFSRAINKLWYGLYGAEDALKASCSDLPQQIVLEADGMKIPIPKDCRGLIILNIDSYLGGVPLWSRAVSLYEHEKSTQAKRSRRYSDGEIAAIETMDSMKRTSSFDSIIGDDIETHEAKLERILSCDSPSSCQDGRLDVISIRGNFHLGQIRVGLANAQKLCQCSRLKIELKKSIAVQIDGEPWKQDRCILKIDREKDPAIMLHRAAEGGGGVEIEVADLLEWAEENNIIKRDAHATLMKEFSRRIESKTRERRDRNDNNVFSAMKKTLASRNKLSQMSYV